MSRLFQPLALGNRALEHRVAMAPLTRYRMDDDWSATELSQGRRALKLLYVCNIGELLLTAYSLLRSKILCPRHPHRKRSNNHREKRCRLLQRSRNMVQRANFCMEENHHSSAC